ncbi:uncharacterized protein LOC111385451 [Olea europaea var. sylvestris]|uniref:uncharacterized protein LOC111385451 n=1 Tax=Olea europaea var. sylvestris TaxID=158386 RepID=UPI000C1D5AD1|nr:uncharacterized protein LOC111385451 [Olea europaea var. sylvestris]
MEKKRSILSGGGSILLPHATVANLVNMANGLQRVRIALSIRRLLNDYLRFLAANVCSVRAWMEVFEETLEVFRIKTQIIFGETSIRFPQKPPSMIGKFLGNLQSWMEVLILRSKPQTIFGKTSKISVQEVKPWRFSGSYAKIKISNNLWRKLPFMIGVSEDDSDFVDSENNVEDEDDTLYEQNVTDGIEIGLDGHYQIQDEWGESNDMEVDALEYPTEELLSQCSSDEESGFRFPQFSAKTDMKNPQFVVGQIFSSVVEFKKAVRTYSALNGYNVKFTTNEERRVQGVCKVGCEWRIWASSFDDTDTLQFKVDPDWKTKLILATVKKDLHIDISRNVSWKMKRYAREVLVGTMHDQFEQLRSYAVDVLRINAGSTVIIALQQQVFQGMYVCFNGCKMGFRNGCRRVVGIDGCHLRGCIGGILLSVVSIDGNDCICPIAYAVVQKENTPTWRWFMIYLREDIEIGNGRGWTLMTNRQKGLQNVTNELFPEAEHRFCVRHMYTNFFNVGFKGKTLENYLWHAAKSTIIPDYKHWMQQICNISEDAYKWLMERPPQEWSRSYFSLHSKSDILLNNICEVFNKTLRSENEKMILKMLTSMQLVFMIRIRKHGDTMMRCNGRLCPKIRKKLNKNADRSRECTLHLSDGLKWQVDCSSGTYVVNLLERSCVRREWELIGIPCMHAIAVIRECRNDPEECVDSC